MKALINKNTNRICQVQKDTFPVSPSLEWTDCPKKCTTRWTYDGKKFTPPAIPPLAESKTKKQESNKRACQNFIYSKYPQSIQSSAGLGIYPQETVDTMIDHIARIVTEENRVFDLIEAATTNDELNAIQDPDFPEV